MLPTQESKLLAQWQGPYEITQKMGPTTYEIATQRHAQRILHLNLLKESVSRSDKKEVVMIRRVEEDDNVDEQLTVNQQA